MSLSEGFSKTLDDVVPKAVAFGTLHANERDILVFSLYDGDIFTLRGGKQVDKPCNVGALIGDVAVDVHKKVLCMDDPSTGANLYRLDGKNIVHIKTFKVAVTKRKRARQVAFVDEGRKVVCGSDHGIVYMFDRRSGEVVDELKVDVQEWVQTLTVSEHDGTCTIYAAKSRDLDGPNHISVWRKRPSRRFGAWGFLCGVVVTATLTTMILLAMVVHQYRYMFVRAI
ncbi:hypothetical protein HMN09_00920700 [Mycena chlorophos]|uniref:WD40 repeat-like protein n=1 Tax=Mycena chlorophos TaxID=658473 RepID=A0A8H6VZW5_MYCCL|nr:hypothetical protein HMN09_00920700 [Mycena chlorophos]